MIRRSWLFPGRKRTKLCVREGKWTGRGGGAGQLCLGQRYMKHTNKIRVKYLLFPLTITESGKTKLTKQGHGTSGAREWRDVMVAARAGHVACVLARCR